MTDEHKEKLTDEHKAMMVDMKIIMDTNTVKVGILVLQKYVKVIDTLV